jgi:hypothetical protein
VRVTDEFGEPVAGAAVQVQVPQWGPDGQVRLVSIGGTSNVLSRANQTDDRGQVRLFGLSPGQYILQASVRERVGADNAAEGFAPTFYPGTIALTQAEQVRVGIGEELPVTFALVPARMSRIRGRVLDSRGQPAAGAIVTMSMVNGVSQSVPFGSVGADGTFVTPAIPTGEYALSFSMTRGTVTEVARVPLSVTNGVDQLAVVLGRGASVSGRVVFEGGQPPAPDPNNPWRVSVTTAQSQSRLPTVGPMSGRDSGHIGNDGSFRVGSPNARVFFGVTPMPSGWALKSVILDGRDVTDVPVDLTQREELSDLRVTLTNRVTTLAGGVTNARGQTVKDYVLAIQAADEKEPSLAARAFPTASPDS